MGEIGIHLEYIFIVSFECPFESCDIGSSESQFAGSFEEEQSSRVIDLELADDSGGIIGGMVIDDQDMEFFGQVHHSEDQVPDIFSFLVGWDDDEGVGHGDKEQIIVWAKLVYFYHIADQGLQYRGSFEKYWLEI
jgi:hypothetical protein